MGRGPLAGEAAVVVETARREWAEIVGDTWEEAEEAPIPFSICGSIEAWWDGMGTAALHELRADRTATQRSEHGSGGRLRNERIGGLNLYTL